ncbi:MAG: GntR family transcriptional regulator [Lachnospiraceae bacterium]|nr:GntR family transcriptional regulator [Lachnospiraceae bacterium]MBP3506075.1 GntR family transcriptional regulator [Lachnospiraceae bacterium]
MLIEIDFNSNEALYIQLRNQIILGIAKDMLRDGDSLPSVRQMANELGVNMHTVNKAYALLRQDGYVKLDRRNGAVISVSMENKSHHVENIHSNMEMIVAQAVCKNITLEEMQKLVEDMYDTFSSARPQIDIIVEEKE